MLFEVDDIRKTNELARGKSAGRVSSGENFADYLKTGTAEKNKEVQATAALTSADAIFAAQSVSDEEERQIRKKLIKKGSTLLDNLEEIRDGLLRGEISKDRLIEISRLVKQKDVSSADEKLQEIMQEIELRVEVELAKLMR